ncbi:MAG: hypothetical protein AAFR04_11745, partial [Pseudomonadota bacterium]
MMVVSLTAAQASAVSKLPGRWTGWGSVTLDNGSKEKVRCVATYFLKSGGRALNQNLRCTTSSSFKISARSAFDHQIAA